MLSLLRTFLILTSSNRLTSLLHRKPNDRWSLNVVCYLHQSITIYSITFAENLGFFYLWKSEAKTCRSSQYKHDNHRSYYLAIIHHGHDHYLCTDMWDKQRLCFHLANTRLTPVQPRSIIFKGKWYSVGVTSKLHENMLWFMVAEQR